MSFHRTCASAINNPSRVTVAVGFLILFTFWSSYSAEALRTGSRSLEAARGVLGRLLAARVNDFSLHLIPRENGNDVFEVSASGGKVSIRGSDAIAMCRGAYHYLRSACNVEVTWSGTHCSLPARLPDFPKTRIICPNTFRQYFNVCTFGYTTVWWDWPRWQREIDWMALHGINMPLAMVGEEAVWQRVWKSMGITDRELADYFTGPAFLPWHRMGNVNKHGGPLPQEWIDRQEQLQKKILDRMRALDMTPVVPAFSGFVPAAFQKLHPEAHIEENSAWGDFPEDCRTHLLFPTSPLFHEIGVRFIREYQQTFGPVHYYLADSFNEMAVPVTPQNRYPELASFGKAVYSSIADADPRGIWVMQGWLFYNDSAFWDTASVHALLRDVPDNRMIILDLANELFHGWKAQHGFYGKEWIYSMIHNFGGNNPLNGNLPFVATDPIESLTAPDAGHRVGMGLAPEGVENNDVVYELSTDMMWRRDTVDLRSWLPAYARARYGSCPSAMRRAWNDLLASAYGKGATNIRHAFQQRPRRDLQGNVDVGPTFQRAVEEFLSCNDRLGKEPLYVADAMELVAQDLGGLVDRRLQEAIRAHDSGSPDLRDSLAAQAFSMMDDIDALLDVRPDRRLEQWVSDARKWGKGHGDEDFYEWNAKLQVTLWGGPDLYDYASKMWGGLVRDFYVGRWKKYFSILRTLPVGAEVPADSLIRWEEHWVRQKGLSPARRLVDPVRAAGRMLAHWSHPLQIAPEPVILPDSTVFDAQKGIDVVMRSVDPAGTIRYTTDGSIPTPASRVYGGAFHLDTDAVVMAKGFSTGKYPSFVATRHFSAVVPGRNGLLCRYYEGMWDALPDFDTVTTKQETVSEECTLDAVRHRADYFGLRFDGFLRIDTRGTYTFTVGSDDGSRLTIDSTLVVNNDGLHAYREIRGAVTLDPGLHRFTLDYFESTGAERLSVSMQGDGVPAGAIPASRLYLVNREKN